MRTDRTALPYLQARRYLGVAMVALACLAALMAVSPTVQAQAGSGAARNLERSVKAAFLYKFLGYTEFPSAAFSDPSAPIVIGVVDADDMASELSRIVAGRTVGTRPIVVRSMKEGESAAGVHLLFLSSTATASAARMSKGQQPLLLVTESDSGIAQGSVINFRIIDQRVRFDVSLEAADKHNVKLSSRLLTVAHQVHKGVN
ncbi:MAG TPA: YfiR family protein [Telluria sp.]|nr:YfiR family protein [Telluria sp.]